MPTIQDLNSKYSNAPAPTRTPPPQPGFFSKVGSGIKQGLTNAVTMPVQLAKGIVTGFGNMGRETVASGVRGIQAIPDTVQQIGADIKGNKVAAQEHAASADAILQAPINNTPTYAGSSIPQNLGSAAQWASFLVPGTKLGTLAQAGLGGALFQGGTEATNPNATGASIAENTGEGAVLGATTAGALDFGSNLIGKVTGSSTTELPSETYSSRTQDATPSYDMVKKGKGQYGYDLTGKVNAPLEEGKTIPRVTEAKKGLTGFGERTVNTSSEEYAVGQELDKLKNYPDKGTALEKTHAVNDAISEEADSMRKQVRAEDKAHPLNPKAKDIVTKNVLNNMNRQAREVVMSRGQGIEGDAMDRAGTVQGRYAQDTAEALNNYNGTREGILDLRQAEDKIYKAQRGKAAFGDNNWNALDDMHSKIRDYLNQELNESTQSVDTKVSLNKQTKLYRASDVLDEKAHAEGINEFQTWAKNHPELYRNLKRLGIGIGTATALGGSGYTIGRKINQAIQKIGK